MSILPHPTHPQAIKFIFYLRFKLYQNINTIQTRIQTSCHINNSFCLTKRTSLEYIILWWNNFMVIFFFFCSTNIRNRIKICLKYFSPYMVDEVLLGHSVAAATVYGKILHNNFIGGILHSCYEYTSRNECIDFFV